MKWIWKFRIYSLPHWRKIGQFWDSGGTINTFSEWMFFIVLLLLIPLWIIGWHKASKVPIIKIIFFPIFWYHNYQEKKYAQMPKSIVLKNMGASIGGKQSQKQAMEEMIANRMPKEKDKKDLNSNKIRSSFEEKSRSFHEKAGEQQ